MESMQKTRSLLAGAFIVVSGAIALLLLYPFENQLIFWSARGLAGLLGIFSLAIVTVSLATYFPADGDDPWGSSYFRYMRNFWGNAWGGYGHPYHISVCPAVRYTWLTLFFWFLFVGALGFLTYHALVVGIGGLEASPLRNVNSKGDNVIENIIGIIVVFGILCNMAIFQVFKILFSTPANLSPRVDSVFGALVFVLALITLVVAPIQTFDAMADGKAVFWIVAAVAGSAFVGWLLYVIVKMLFKGVKGLHNTAPGQLFSALHETLCPEIVEKCSSPKEAQ